MRILLSSNVNRKERYQKIQSEWTRSDDTSDLEYYLCASCDEFFPLRKFSHQNIANHDKKNASFKCPCCSEQYALLDNLKEHGGSSLVCHLCIFKTKNDEMKHNSQKMLNQPRMKEQKTLKKCRKCSLQTCNLDKCKDCLFKTCNIDIMTKHRFKKHIGPMPIIAPKPKICMDCGEHFMKPRELRKHKKIHNIGKKLSACFYCSYRSDYPKGILKHLRKMHKNLDVAYKCALCSYCSVNLNVFTRHLHFGKHEKN